MKFLVLGHFSFDVFHPLAGPETSSYGGIYYSVATLASLLGSSDRVIPVFGVNVHDYQPFLSHLKEEFPNVETAGIYQIGEPTNTVHFFEKDHGTRVECSKDVSKPIPFENVRNFLKVDGILINMVSGFDITLETLDEVRLTVREKKVPIHFDFHSLTLGITEHHERFRRPVSDWRRWCFMTDTIQLNEEEIADLTLEKLSEEQTVGHMLTLSVKGVVVTRGARGATLFFSEQKTLTRRDVEGTKLPCLGDSTGCGDVFGAAFLLHYVTTHDLFGAAEFGNRIAALRTQAIGAQDIDTIFVGSKI